MHHRTHFGNYFCHLHMFMLQRMGLQFAAFSVASREQGAVRPTPYLKFWNGPRRCFCADQERPPKRLCIIPTVKKRKEKFFLQICGDCLGSQSLWSKQDPCVECWFRRVEGRKFLPFRGKEEKRVQDRQGGHSSNVGSKSIDIWKA